LTPMQSATAVPFAPQIVEPLALSCFHGPGVCVIVSISLSALREADGEKSEACRKTLQQVNAKICNQPTNG
jgi:hypothetical protein